MSQFKQAFSSQITENPKSDGTYLHGKSFDKMVVDISNDMCISLVESAIYVQNKINEYSSRKGQSRLLFLDCTNDTIELTPVWEGDLDALSLTYDVVAPRIEGPSNKIIPSLKKKN